MVLVTYFFFKSNLYYLIISEITKGGNIVPNVCVTLIRFLSQVAISPYHFTFSALGVKWRISLISFLPCFSSFGASVSFCTQFFKILAIYIILIYRTTTSSAQKKRWRKKKEPDWNNDLIYTWFMYTLDYIYYISACAYIGTVLWCDRIMGPTGLQM